MFHVSMRVNCTNVRSDYDIFLIWKSLFLYYYKYDYLSLVVECQLSKHDDEYRHDFTKYRYECVLINYLPLIIPSYKIFSRITWLPCYVRLFIYLEHTVQRKMQRLLADEVNMISKITDICYNMTFCTTTFESMYDNIALNARFQTVGKRRHLFLNVQGSFKDSRFPYEL